jgi:hypothetical protein
VVRHGSVLPVSGESLNRKQYQLQKSLGKTKAEDAKLRKKVAELEAVIENVEVEAESEAA